jgi:hypothetical protein
MMVSNFELLSHAHKVTPKYQQRVKYLEDTIAQLRTYHLKATKSKKSLLAQMITQYENLHEICIMRLEKLERKTS